MSHHTEARCPQSGKVQHIDETAAKLVLRQMRRGRMREHPRDSERLRAYRCWTCGYWHVGKLPEAEARS